MHLGCRLWQVGFESTTRTKMTSPATLGLKLCSIDNELTGIEKACVESCDPVVDFSFCVQSCSGNSFANRLLVVGWTCESGINNSTSNMSMTKFCCLECEFLGQ